MPHLTGFATQLSSLCTLASSRLRVKKTPPCAKCQYNSSPMNLVTLAGVHKRFGERPLLANASLLINEGERIGLLGRNGSGKTTLLRMIAGLDTADSGQLTIWGNVRVRYLPQQPNLDPNLTVLETIFQTDTPQMALLRHYEQVSLALHHQPSDTALQQQLGELSAEMDRLGGWTAEANAKTILTKLGITQFEAAVGTLSGGQERRVALAQALLNPGHLLILDEPTNHIDADTVQWLEEYLQGMSAALLMVTHDRYFLERVANTIVELDRRELIRYEGNYSQYLEQRTTRQELLARHEQKRQVQLRRELAWLRRGPQARATKQKGHIQRVEALLEVQYDPADERVAMALASRRLGQKVLEAEALCKSYGDLALFANLDLRLEQGERLGIVGPNGAGKSSLLEILAGKLPPDNGRITWGPTAVLGYFDQHNEELEANAHRTVADYMGEIAPLIQTPDGERIETAQMLEWFLFSRPEQRTLLGSLSGGEKRRLYLLRTLAIRPNVLFLDEPTNDLDVETLAVLEQFLDAFTGSLIVVSHDRYFLDRNVDFVLSFEAGRLGTRLPTPYVPQTRPTAAPPPAISKPAAPPTATAAAPRKLTWKEARELETLEEQLPVLEAKVAELSAALNGADYQRLAMLTAELEATQAVLDEALERWLALSEV